jgi:hypothetical protein
LKTSSQTHHIIAKVQFTGRITANPEVMSAEYGIIPAKICAQMLDEIITFLSHMPSFAIWISG